AMVMFHNSQKAPITVTVCGKDEDTTFSKTFPGDEMQRVPVLGLYDDTETSVILEMNGRKKELQIFTKIPDGEKPHVLSLNRDPQYRPKRVLFYSSALRDWPAAIDNNGDTRWIITVAMQWQMQRLNNGHYLIGTERQVTQPYYVSGFYEIDLTGRIYNEINIPSGYHHDFVEMEDGTLLVANTDTGGYKIPWHDWLQRNGYRHLRVCAHQRQAHHRCKGIRFHI
ncbi:MAG: aryl-sulfate sulfotransferase, partial [Lachnospiraceae bacterium]|nr:aryl-sulfate sulfotransferase [Lachnospiraceae bacterium]